MPAAHTLRDLLVDELKDLYNAENQLLKALPRMAKAAHHEDLRAGFTRHLEQTQEHVDRLDRALKLLGAKSKGKICHAMQGLIEEGTEAIQTEGPYAVRDAKLIGAAQRVEHYEIAAYGTVRAFAETLGETQVAAILQDTLNEEGETNQELTTLSQAINAQASAAPADDEKPFPAEPS
jgi:ferritin-like metal-binding protein YciE